MTTLLFLLLYSNSFAQDSTKVTDMAVDASPSASGVFYYIEGSTDKQITWGTMASAIRDTVEANNYTPTGTWDFSGGTVTLPAESVTAGVIDTNAVTTEEILDGTIVGDDIANSTIDVIKFNFLNTGKNLFNKATVIDSQLVSNTTYLIDPQDGWATTDYIAVTPLTEYYGSNFPRAAKDVIFYDANKVKISGATGNPFTTPAGTYFIIFTVYGPTTGTNLDNAQLEAGASATTFEPFGYVIDVDTNSINIYAKNIYEDQIEIGVTQTKYNLNITTADKIGFFGDSYLRGEYVQKDIHPVALYSNYSDFIVENFSDGGLDYQSGLEIRFRSNKLIRYDYFRPTYAVFNFMYNDVGKLSLNEFEYFSERFMIEVKTRGAQPIVSNGFKAIVSESKEKYVAFLRELADKNGYDFIDNLLWSNNLSHYNNSGTPTAINKPQALEGTNHHPNSMGALYFSEFMKRELKQLVPYQSLKIWRADTNYISGLSLSEVRDTLRFTNREDILEMFDEISIFHDYGHIRAGESKTNQDNDYYTLMLNASVDFYNGFAMVEFILPSPDIQTAKLTLKPSAGTYNIYAYNRFGDSTSTTYASSTNYDIPEAFTWDSIGTITGGYASEITVTSLDGYYDGRRLYFLIQKSDSTDFTLSASPDLEYTMNQKQVGKNIIKTEYLSDELITNPYFNTTGSNTWYNAGATFISGNTKTWTFPDTTLSYPIRTPFESDDSLVVLSTGDSLYKSFDMSSYPVGSTFKLQIFSQNDSAAYNAYSYLDVKLTWGSDSTGTNVYTRTLDVYPVWMDGYIYFRKNYTYDTVWITLKKNSGADINISKVGIRRVL